MVVESRSASGGAPAHVFHRWELFLYGALLAYFAARIVFLALRIHPAVPPDEITHIGRLLTYATVWGVPDNGPATYEYGLIDQRPWLYYWVLGKLVGLNVFGLRDLVFARLANCVLGLGTAVLGILWMREWCSNAIARALFAVFVTNTLMFTGLAASVTYDNGANLLAAGAIFAFARFRNRRTAPALLVFFAVVIAGCLAKRTLLPLAFLLVALLGWRERGELGALAGHASALLRSPEGRGPRLALLAVVLVLAGLATSLYGGNLVKYGRLQPGFDQVVGERDAMRNRVYARSRILERFQAGEIGLERARQLAETIRHRGDRHDTLFLLRAAQLPESSVVGGVAYASEWGQRMLGSAVGYLGHRRATKGPGALLPYFLVFGVALVLAIRTWRPGEARGATADAACLAAGYALILMWLVNYPNYVTSKYIELALQGRYLFPMLLPVYGLVAWYLIEPLPPRARPWLAAAAAGIYLYGDLPWFLQQVDERWFMPPGS